MMSGDVHSMFFHEERYQSLERVRDIPIAICGVGSLGGPIAENMARMGYKRLTLIDGGRVEERNLSCQPYSRAEVGAWKVRALANTLYRAVQARIEPIASGLHADNSDTLLAGTSLVVDAFDNHAGRLAVAQRVLKTGTACLHVGFSGDGLYGCGLWEPGYVVPREAEGDPCDYPLTRPFAQLIAALACRVIGDYLGQGECQDFEVTWHDLHVTLHQR